jgi:hypothetical protein
MPNHHAHAHGLRLESTFPLPGMACEQAMSLPPLCLRLLRPEELEHRWQDPSWPVAWRGRLGDGLELSIQFGQDGDALFRYGERARFLLDASKSELLCAPSETGLHWQRTLIGKVLPSVSLLCGYEALHAAALDSPEGVVAIAAPSGTGKSTLALELLLRGWQLFADDVLTLRSEQGTVLGQPGSPHMNVAAELPGALDPQLLGQTLGFLAGERWLAAHRCTREPRPIRMICLLERRPGLVLQARTLPCSPLPLAPYMLSLPSDADRERSRFCLYADLVQSTTLVHLTAGAEHPPAQIADTLQQALECSGRPLAGVAR